MNAPATGDWQDQHGTNHLTPSASRPTATEGVTFRQAVDTETVRRWLDKSGNGRHLDQATLANQPTLTSGKIVFGLSKGMTHTLELPGEYSAFAVAKKTSAGAGYNIILYARQAALFASGASVDQWGMYATTDILSGKSLLTEKCIGVISPTDTSVLLLDGAETITATRGARFTSGGSVVGAANGMLSNLLGNISELVVCNVAVPVSSGQKIIKYLSRKWGVAT
jgi:hypothetical protein